MDRWKEKLRELCGIDIRSLAILRIGLALIVLVDLFVRLQDLKAHYTDEGVLPRDVVISTDLIDPWNISLHLFNGSWEFQGMLFILAAVFAIALLIGYYTRLATILSWLLLISLHTRNPMILQGGDIELRLLFFWAMFLPLGACWSIDQRINKKTFSNQIVSIATLGLLLQICFVYWFSALLKSDVSWRQDGTAIWYALSIEQYSTPFGLFLLQFPTFLKGLTFGTLYLEAFGPFFAFSPFWTGPLRFATAAIFILFHVGLNLTMELGIFSYVCIVAWLVFIPEWFWDHILKLQQRTLSTYYWRASRLSNVLAAFFLVYIFLWNVNTLEVSVPLLPSSLKPIASILRIDQYWNMFAPYPLVDDGWYVIPGHLRDGAEVNLFNAGLPVSWKKPPLLSAIYDNDRWRSYMMNLPFDEDSEVYLLYYAQYLCRQWNRTHPHDKQLRTLDIVYMSKVNTWEGPPIPYKKTILWKHHCG